MKEAFPSKPSELSETERLVEIEKTRDEAENPEYPTADSYARENLSARRRELADKIRRQRTEYFAFKEREKNAAKEKLPLLAEDRNRLINDIERATISLAKYTNRLKLSIFERFFGESKRGRQQRAKLEPQQADQREYYEGLIADLERYDNQIRELEGWATGVVRTNRLKGIREDALGEKSIIDRRAREEWQTHEDKRTRTLARRLSILEELPKRTVHHFIRSADVYFVHGTHPTHYVEQHAHIKEDIDWKDKVRIAVALEPTLSSSSLRPGIDSYKNAFAGIGLVLADGRIDLAFSRDSDTKAISLTERELGDGWGKYRSYVEYDDAPLLADISKVVSEGGQQRKKMNHNELVVSKPKPVALYLVIDEIEDEVDSKAYATPPHAEVIELAEELGLPIFGYKNGHLYACRTEEGQLIAERSINPSEILEYEGVSESTRAQILQNFEGRNMFKD